MGRREAKYNSSCLCTTTKDSPYDECLFPTKWEGTWFQSGVRQSILISRNILSSKGTCLHNEGDKFLLVDEKSCYRCVVIHEKHPNVLQYKETYCHGRNSLASLCSYITGDALLYSMFREDAVSVPCPFHGPMTFTYNRGHGRCSSPLSNVDTCTDESRLLFRYQACPDVPASESAVEELECLGTWKEGSNRYLVGRLHSQSHSLSNEDRYRCFVYERGGSSSAMGLNRAAAAALGIATAPPLDPDMAVRPEGSPDVYRVAQSGDATCNGLFSPLEGSRTMTLTKASSPGKCWFPTWLTGKTSQTWHTLDLTRSYTFHMSNASLQTTKSNGSGSSESPDFLNLPGQEEHNVKILCNSVKVADAEQNIFMIVAHFTVGCQSGYMCMALYKRDGHVVELQTGKPVSRLEEACSPPHYQPATVPFVTLVTSSPEPRQCPYLGKFTVTGVNGNGIPSKKTSSGTRSHHGQDHRFELEVQEKRRGNNQYLVHELMQEQQQQQNRRVRSGMDAEASWIPGVPDLQPANEQIWSSKRHVKLPEAAEIAFREKYRWRRESKLEDFQADMDDGAQIRNPHYSSVSQKSTKLQVNLKSSNSKRSLGHNSDVFLRGLPKHPGFSNFLSYAELTRPKRRAILEEDEDEVDYDDDDEGDEYEEYRVYVNKRRRRRSNSDEYKRQQPKCNSEITTLTVGCSTADRMEFQSDCLDDDFVSAYSCHGRWFDAEGTQFVIATPLVRRSSGSWNGPEGSRAQPLSNSRRLCFMYRENGGVVSLAASPIACQRGEPPPPQTLLAFNATSIGQCTDEASSLTTHSPQLILSALIALSAVFR
ncbi:hypothetical protein QAD02_010228 [Eretmocerus hayati]|uniref:Uncharacterized protein n=1 Tax=Eretmocerus hayati TaxID=131215 RepID=A0ACC2NG35_9HYME|nr:hypothetical protein QAD02_010228 [Eretmocerus hayati]